MGAVLRVNIVVCAVGEGHRLLVLLVSVHDGQELQKEKEVDGRDTMLKGISLGFVVVLA